MIILFISDHSWEIPNEHEIFIYFMQKMFVLFFMWTTKWIMNKKNLDICSNMKKYWAHEFSNANSRKNNDFGIV